MHLLWDLILTLGCYLTLSQAQNLLYADRRRSGHSYNQPYISPYSGSAGFYKHPSTREATWNYGSASLKGNGGSSVPVKPSYPSYNSYANKGYSSRYSNANSFKVDNASHKNGKQSISKADAENAKFLGAENQENDYDSRTLHLKRKKFHRRFNGALINPCVPYGRDAGKSGTEQGRFLWDINVHNYYPQSALGSGCGGYGGGGFGAGLLSDPIGPAYYPPGTGIASFLSLFAPGILQNSLAATVRPQQLADYSQTVNNNDLQSDPEVDPNYKPVSAPFPVRRPNQLFYDSVGAPPVTPAQLVGGVSTTVNGIIQQLTGNVQPVYG